MKKADYTVRNVNYEELHGVTEEQFQELIEHIPWENDLLPRPKGRGIQLSC